MAAENIITEKTPAEVPDKGVGCRDLFGVWVLSSERLPTIEDANDRGEVWWWIPRHASHGPQRDYWNEPESSTHWMRCPDGMCDDDDRPDPPSPNNRDLQRGRA